VRNDERQTPALAEVIGRNIRRIREASGWSQDQLAARLRQGGFDMTRSSVAALERAGRSFDVAELLLLCMALTSTPEELLAGDGPVRITEAAEVDLKSLRRAVAGIGGLSFSAIDTPETREARALPAKAMLSATKVIFGLRPGASDAEIRRAQASGKAEAEQKVAKRLAMPPAHVGMASFALWGRSLTDERECRVAGRVASVSDRSARMIRAHATREIEQQLRLYLEKEGYKWPR
jgi:transcriptional regulator with XRE-family HTH domain